MVKTVGPTGLIFLLGLAFTIAFFHALGHAYGLYFTISWYDTPLHIAGGAWLASAAFVILKRVPQLTRYTSRPVVLFVFITGIALVVGGLWELYEYMLDLWYGKSALIRGNDPLTNTGLDMINDFIGALLVYGWIYFYEIKRGKSRI